MPVEERLPLTRAGELCGELLRREDGLHTTFSARVARGAGVQKLWLCGEGGEPLLLGTLMPLGGGWRLERTVSSRTLRERGLTGALRGEITPGPPPGERWQETACSAPEAPPDAGQGGEVPVTPRDALLARLLAGTRRGRWTADGHRWRLALPWRRGEAFPLVPAFCLARVEGEAVCYYFSAEGEILPPPV